MNKVLTVTLNPCIDKSLVTEGFDCGKTNIVLNTKKDIGGKGINVSKVLNNFGIENIATGILMGNNGLYIKEELDRLYIKNRFLLTEGETRVNIKITDRQSKVTTELNERGLLNDKNTVEDFICLFKEICPEKGFVILSGSVPTGIDDGIYARLINIAKERESKAILDCCNNLLLNGIKESPYAIKPNISEFEAITNTRISGYMDIVREIKRLKQYNVDLYVVSMGKDGAVFTDGKNTVLAVPFCIDCKSTVGAGDTMIAALVYSNIHKFDLYNTAKFATAAGTLTCCYDGSGVCNIDEVQRMYNCIEIKEVG